MIGKQGGYVLVTLVERKSRFTVMGLAPNRTSEKVKNVIVSKLKPLSSQAQTLTYDNGKEFALHFDISNELDACDYSAHPYHSWNEEQTKILTDLFVSIFLKI